MPVTKVLYRGICKSRTHLSTAASNNNINNINSNGHGSSHSSSSHGEANLAKVFVTICTVFAACHALHLFLAADAFTRASAISDCLAAERAYIPPLWLLCANAVDNVLIMANSAANVAVYCVVSTHFKVLPIWAKW